MFDTATRGMESEVRSLGVSSVFEEFLLKCFQIDPTNRPSAEELASVRRTLA